MLKDDCLFCKIIKGGIPADKVYENDNILAFKDINPAAPVHILIIPKEHIETLNDITPSNSRLISEIFEKIPEIAAEFNLKENGYRVAANCGRGAGQEVFHIHFHIIGGRALNWPPG